jgi:hypothetical protein
VSGVYTPMMKVRDRTVWLTDHPGAAVKFKRGGSEEKTVCGNKSIESNGGNQQ